MDEFSQIAKRYGATVDRGRGLTKVSMPVQFPARLDVGFATSYYWTWIGRLLPFLRHYQIANGLYVFGNRAETLSRMLGRDGDLCSAIRRVFDQYAFDLECSDMRVSARVNSIARPFSLDPTGGVSLLSSLAVIANGLSGLDHHEYESATESRLVWGPSRSRKVFTCSILVCIFSMTILLPHVASYLWPHINIHR
jgi:hypothetical protein